MPQSIDPQDRIGLWRRAFSLLYELLLLTAVVLAAAVVLVPLTRLLDPMLARPLLRFALLVLVASYFIWQWTHGGQTLAMKTWRIKLVGPGGTPLTVRRALLRFVLGAAGTLLAGLGFAWACVDRDRQYLHDRLAGTRLVKAEGEPRKSQE